MTKHTPAGQETEESWLEELLAVSGDEKMTPKQTAILQAAVEVFAEKGYSGAATSEIAQRAGVAEGTIFRYYKTKKDLLISIIGPTISRLIAPFILRNFNNILEAPFDSYEDFLRALTKNRLEFARNNFKILKILIQEIPFQPALKEQFMENISNSIWSRIVEITRHYQDAGELVDLPTPAVIRFTISAVMGYLLTRFLLLPERDWDDEEEIELTIRFILHGIGRPQGEGEKENANA